MGKVIGDRIKAERAARGWTQKELAALSGIGFGYIRMLETNQRPNPTGETLDRLARAFGITVDALLHGPPASDTEGPPLAELRAVGWPEHRVARLEKIWPELTAGERAGHIRRAHTMYAEWQKLEDARRRLQADVEALNAELDRGESFEEGDGQAFTMKPRPKPV